MIAQSESFSWCELIRSSFRARSIGEQRVDGHDTNGRQELNLEWTPPQRPSRHRYPVQRSACCGSAGAESNGHSPFDNPVFRKALFERVTGTSVNLPVSGPAAAAYMRSLDQAGLGYGGFELDHFGA